MKISHKIWSANYILLVWLIAELNKCKWWRLRVHILISYFYHHADLPMSHIISFIYRGPHVRYSCEEIFCPRGGEHCLSFCVNYFSPQGRGNCICFVWEYFFPRGRGHCICILCVKTVCPQEAGHCTSSGAKNVQYFSPHEAGVIA